jgi:hypothetical protein
MIGNGDRRGTVQLVAPACEVAAVSDSIDPPSTT